jgi:hypothetical protein|nr:MAG TPA: Ferredoxin-like domain in Api92-like protein [Caudoviricetes sp.]
MPNWAEGTIKIRGTKNQIINYLKNVFEGSDFWGNDMKIEIMNDDDSIVLRGLDDLANPTTAGLIPQSPKFHAFYFKGANRAFTKSENNILVFGFFGDAEAIEIIEMPFKQAWSVEADDFVKLSKKYCVDLKIFVFESGMEFTQEIEIIKGKITKDKTREYDDYQWDVPFSRLGG